MHEYEQGLARIKERYGFDRLRRGKDAGSGATAALPETLNSLSRTERYAVDGGYIDTYGDQAGHMVKIWVFRHPTHAAARETLAEYLLTSMAPQLPHGKDVGLDVGDIAFGGMEETQTSVVFVRNNTFVRIHSVGDEPYDLKNLVHAVDEVFA